MFKTMFLTWSLLVVVKNDFLLAAGSMWFLKTCSMFKNELDLIILSMFSILYRADALEQWKTIWLEQ